jgi:hypothetical protein
VVAVVSRADGSGTSGADAIQVAVYWIFRVQVQV